MSERDALIRAICESPADDLPRLVYADYVEEQGETDLAEFVRLQCEIARHLSPGQDASVLANAFHRKGWRQHPKQLKLLALAELQQRERVLLSANVMEWFRTLPDLPEWADSVRWSMPESNELDLTFEPVGLTLETGWLGSNKFMFHRGFVRQAYLNLTSFVGGPCPQYFTEEPHPLPDDTQGWECEICQGTGRVVGCAKALFESQPIEKIVILDLEPKWQQGEIAFRLRWKLTTSDCTSYPRDAITRELSQNLWGQFYDNSTLWRSLIHQNKPWELDGRDAVEALSAACVNYGRQLVGLSSLPTPPQRP